jgi:hypothetical protein
MDAADNDLWIVFGDNQSDTNRAESPAFNFRRIMVGEIDTSNPKHFFFTNKGGGSFPFDYDIFAYLNPVPEKQTSLVSRYINDANPIIAHGSDDWVKDPHVFYDGTTYWMFCQFRDAATSDSEIWVYSTTDILNGTWGSATLISSPGTGEVKHEFPWVTKYGGTWYMFYGVEESPLDWEIQYKTTTQTNPTSGWSSATTVLSAGAGGDFDDGGVSVPYLIWHDGTFTGGTWYLVYGGYDGVGDWEGGIAKSTSGITGTYTRVDTNPVFAKETFDTDCSGAQNTVTQITADTTTGLEAGMVIFLDEPYGITEVLSIDSGTTFTIPQEVSKANNDVIRQLSYDSFVPIVLQRVNNYWVAYGTSFKFFSGDSPEYISIYVDTTGNLALEDCTFREAKVGDAAIDYVIPIVPLDELANENPGRVHEEMTPIATDPVPYLTPKRRRFNHMIVR